MNPSWFKDEIFKDDSSEDLRAKRKPDMTDASESDNDSIALRDLCFGIPSDFFRKPTVSKSYVNKRKETLYAHRPAALNCYDYIRLKDEVERVRAIVADFDAQCKTLICLIGEVEKAEMDNPRYPIRPFPFSNVKSKSPWAYHGRNPLYDGFFS